MEEEEEEEWEMVAEQLDVIETMRLGLAQREWEAANAMPDEVANAIWAWAERVADREVSPAEEQKGAEENEEKD